MGSGAGRKATRRWSKEPDVIENGTNPRQNNEIATGCLRYVFALW